MFSLQKMEKLTALFIMANMQGAKHILEFWLAGY